MGFLKSAKVHVDDGHPAVFASDVLRSLLRSESARFLQGLVVRFTCNDVELLEVLSAAPRTLRALDLPELSSLSLECDTMVDLTRAKRAPLHHIEKLSLRLTNPYFRLSELLSRMPQLRSLHLLSEQEATLKKLVEQLVQSDAASRLTRLQLGGITADNLSKFVESASGWDTLEALMLDHDNIGPIDEGLKDSLNALQARFGDRLWMGAFYPRSWDHDPFDPYF